MILDWSPENLLKEDILVEVHPKSLFWLCFNMLGDYFEDDDSNVPTFVLIFIPFIYYNFQFKKSKHGLDDDGDDHIDGKKDIILTNKGIFTSLLQML